MDVDSDGWLVCLSKDGSTRQIAGMNFDLNTQAAAAIARDKVATSSRLQSVSIAHVPHCLFRVDADGWSDHAMNELLDQGDVVIKPLEGGDGKHVYRIRQAADTKNITHTTVESWATSPWQDISKELRIVVVNGECWLAYEKTKPVIVNGLKFFNLSLGAVAQHVDVQDISKSIRELAAGATGAIGLHIAAVDIVITEQGVAKVLEINSAFSLTRYAKTNTATYDEVAVFYDRLIASMFST